MRWPMRCLAERYKVLVTAVTGRFGPIPVRTPGRFGPIPFRSSVGKMCNPHPHPRWKTRVGSL